MALALDTNCLLRWLLQDNPVQATTVARYFETTPGKLHVADIVFAEAVWVLKRFYGFDDELIEGLMRKVVEHDKINCNRALFGRVLDHLSSSPKVSFVDTCLVFYAALGDGKLLTFDKALSKKFPRLVKLAS